MKKMLVFMTVFVVLFSLSFAKPKVSSSDGVINDSKIRSDIAGHFNNKIRFKSASDVINLGLSNGKMKGTVWGQNVIFEMKTRDGYWVQMPTISIYIVESSNGKLSFAGMEELKQ